MATLRYVNTANGTSGDGTTNETDSSADSAYVSLAEAIDGLANDNTGNGEYVIECTGGKDNDPVTEAEWVGWTTTASDPIVVRTATADRSPLDTDVTNWGYYIEMDVNANEVVIGRTTATGVDVHIRFEHVLMRKVFDVGTSTNRVMVRHRGIGTSGGGYQGEHRFDNCIFDGSAWGNTSTGDLQLFDNAALGDFDIKFYNCLFKGDNTSPPGTHNYYGAEVAMNGGVIVNCTFDDLETGVVNGAAPTILNNIFQNCTTDLADGTPGTDVKNNLTDNATINSNATNQVSKTISFRSSTDFHLPDGSTSDNADAIGTGIGPSTESAVPTTDPDGHPRSGTTTNMGADMLGLLVYINDAATLDSGAIVQTYPGIANIQDTQIDMQTVIDITGLSGPKYLIVETATGAIASRAITIASGAPVITDVNTTESWTDGDTGLVITGTDFV